MRTPFFAWVACAAIALTTFPSTPVHASWGNAICPEVESVQELQTDKVIKDEVWMAFAKSMDVPVQCLKTAHENGWIEVQDLGSGTYRIVVLKDQWIGCKYFSGGLVIIVLDDDY